MNTPRIFAKIHAEIFASIAWYFGASSACHDEVEQFANLVNIGLAANPLGCDFITFQENSIAPVNRFQAIGFAIPKKVFGINIIINNLFIMGGMEQIQQ